MVDKMKFGESDFRYAGLKVRVIAMAYDLALIAGYAAILAIAASVFFRLTSASHLMDSAWTRDGVAFLTLVLPTVLYFAIQESSRQQATFGKRKMGLRVTDGLGRRLNIGRALLRSGGKFLPWQMAHTAVFQIWEGSTSPFYFTLSLVAQALVIFYLLSLAINKRHRTLYDQLAGSAVVWTDRTPFH